MKNKKMFTYGSSSKTLSNPLIKITNTKVDDKLNGRTNAQSLNNGKNCFTCAMMYCQTTKTHVLHSNGIKSKGGHQTSNGLHEDAIPIISVWCGYDWREEIEQKYGKGHITSRRVSNHHAKIQGISSIQPFHNKSNWYSPDFENDAEIIVQDKRIMPKPDFILVSSDAQKLGISLEQFRQKFNVSEKTILIQSGTILTNCKGWKTDRYAIDKEFSRDKKYKNILLNILEKKKVECKINYGGKYENK